MVGNHNSGRHPTPIAAKLAAGTYRPCKHGAVNPAPVDGDALPPPPADLTGEALAEYERLAGFGFLGANDLAGVLAAAKYWACLAIALDEAEADPMNRAAMDAAKTYGQQHRAAIKALGCDPLNRAKIGVMAKPADSGVRTRRRA